MINPSIVQSASHSIPLQIVAQQHFSKWLAQQSQVIQHWVKASAFEAEPGTICLIPDESQSLATVLVGYDASQDFVQFGFLPLQLPPEIYRFESIDNAPFSLSQLALAWGMGAYQFSRYKAPARAPAQLLLEKGGVYSRAIDQIAAIALVRDLINTPTEDMGPPQLAAAVESCAQQFTAHFNQVVGDELLHQNYPSIHAVGRAAAREPRLIELCWGEPNHPKITLVGKGVCFDSGGLNLKPTAGMLLMKKDMAGAAHALGLAHLIMQRQLPVRLRLLIPAVENAVSANSYRPGDVIKARNGQTVEITNTDAEGRVILSDALTEASSDEPDLLFDFASLTGAARVALGPYVPSFFCNDDQLAQALMAASDKVQDPIWRMPLYQPYAAYMQSTIADYVNASPTPYAGAITAALFLQNFLQKPVPWCHFDFTAWNEKVLPGRPIGGEALAIRAVFQLLEQRLE